MMITRRGTIRAALSLGALATLYSTTATSALADAHQTEIGVVAKVRIPWFDNVEKGVVKAGEELGIKAWMIAPTSDDVAQQVRAVEDLIAQQVDVIGVIPNDSAALEPVFKRAQDAGIKVVVHEQPGQKNADWDIELIQNDEFGEAHMEAFAEALGGEGKYIVYVGGLTVTLHNVWADAAIALQKEKYPDMELVGDRFGVSNSVEDSYNTAIDQMRAIPDLKGILIFGANGPIGAGRAVADREAIGRVTVVGPFIPSQGKSLMKDGAITRGFLWNPIDAGYAMVQLGKLLADGVEVTDGMDIPGLGPVKVEAETRTIRANKMLDINPETIDALAELI
ncbi:substrate-binding domain-containing protein [Sulfitobacter sp. JB4-11]|uniref:substrate-binding domain-containing protein n=1 Tax=Sulfitobacter rhodophyticola TaxID=3238304 RepID=UPI003D818ABA